MEKTIKRQLIESVKVIKNKLKKMQNEEYDTNLQFDKVFKPITEPLKEIAGSKNGINEVNDMKVSNDRELLHDNYIKRRSSISNKSSDSDCVSINSSESARTKGSNNKYTVEKPIPSSSHHKDLKLSSYSELDIPFGLRRVDNDLLIGNSSVEFSALGTTSFINVEGKQYELTDGLKELLLQKTPNLALVTEKDKITYKDILMLTNVHKRYYDANSQIKGDKGIKYNKIIKPLFFYGSDTKNYKLGGNLPTLKKYRTFTDLVYWDDPNELIERLKLLVASKDAGNSNHDNEIIAIIEELKEADIIKE